MALDVRYLKGTAAQYQAYLDNNRIVDYYYYLIQNLDNTWDLYLGKVKLSNGKDFQSVNEAINVFTQYITDHGEIAEGFRIDINKNKEGIAANAKAIEEFKTFASENYETKTDASAKLTEIKIYADNLNTAMDTRVKTLEEINHDGYEAADTVVLAEAKKYADNLNTTINTRVETIESVAHNHANKTVIDSITSDKITAWDASVQNITVGAGLVATKTDNDVAVNIDDAAVFIFDCGTSASNISTIGGGIITYEDDEYGGRTASIEFSNIGKEIITYEENESGGQTVNIDFSV